MNKFNCTRHGETEYIFVRHDQIACKKCIDEGVNKYKPKDILTYEEYVKLPAGESVNPRFDICQPRRLPL